MTLTEDRNYIEVCEAIEIFKKRVFGRIEEGEQKRREIKRKYVMESKMVQERKLNMELETRLMEVSKKGDHLERICANFASGVTISESDRHRLDSAKDMYKIGKHLTRVRFDFSAPPAVAKGYIKCERSRTLRPFEVPAAAAAGDGGDALWALVQGDAEPIHAQANTGR